MRSSQRTEVMSLRTVVMITLAMALVGIAYGAMSVGAGLPVWVAPLLGVVVLAGSSEMLYVGLATATSPWVARSEEHTSELQSRFDLVCRLLLEIKKHIGAKRVDSGLVR